MRAGADNHDRARRPRIVSRSSSPISRARDRLLPPSRLRKPWTADLSSANDDSLAHTDGGRLISPRTPPDQPAHALPASVSDTLALLGRGNYVADRSLATAVYLALKLERPLFLEGEAGVGKTEIAKVLAETLGRRLIRLQCYEGLDVASAVYEWNYPRQMIEIRLAEGRRREPRHGRGGDLHRPLPDQAAAAAGARARPRRRRRCC